MSRDDTESRGLALMDEGNKVFKRQSVWSLFNQSQRFEDAKDKYTKAANLFKMCQSWQLVGQAYEKCAEMDDGLGNQHDAVANRIAAAEAFARTDCNKAVTLYRAVIATQCEMGRFGRAAQLLESVAEMLEKDNKNEEALEDYAKAAEYHSTESNSATRASKCLEKVAFLSASLGDYDQATRTFEQLGMNALENNLLKFGAKKHLLHAGFCILAKGDVVAARMAFDRFSQMDLSFPNSREANVLDALIAAYEEMNTDGFSTALGEYDRVSTLTSWETSILLRIKKTIEETANAAPDLR